MHFEAILDQAMAMLQRRGRVSYSTLALQFHLDAESLEALKEELIEVHHLAVDQDSKLLEAVRKLMSNKSISWKSLKV